jgi:phosphohistidine phosphatase SixA
VTGTRWVVRHACAGHKEDWDGDDDARPLDPAGVAQAAALAELLAADPDGARPRALRSSPPQRCVATLEPLGRALGLSVGIDPLLRSASGDALVELLADPSSAGTVLCTHGEVMEPALPVLRTAGVTVDADDHALLLKGAAWRLDPRPAGGWHLALVVPIPVTTCPHH